ncbi:MAG: hypothetical protein KGI73_04150 [Patescibacteria group bacterium]|nr:hypothetical protein [Patescibacteria group bacterium]
MSAFPSELLIVVSGHALSAFLMLAVGLFVLWRNPGKTETRLFFFLTASTFVYEMLFITASLQTAYAAAYFWWSLNVLVVTITMAVVHFILRVAGRDYPWRWFIRLTYALGVIIVAVAYLKPLWFLPNVLPKLYFFYYLNGGWWYGVFLAYFLIFPLIAAVNLINAYRQAYGVERKRLEYFILMLIVGYGIGTTNFFLVFNIPVDPVIGMFTGFYLLPIAYGIFASDLLDIRIVAKRTLYYALAIGLMAAALTTVVLMDSVLARSIPGLQLWMLPFVVTLIAFTIGRLVLWQLNESERLKYEFITIATHKLRTPLTRIRWTVAELLAHQGVDQKEREGLLRIDDANNLLIELTNTLIEAAHSGDAAPIERSPLALRPLVDEALKRFKNQASEKKLTVSAQVPADAYVLGESRSVGSAIDVLVENAVKYTLESGAVHVAATPSARRIRLSVTDDGIGVAPSDREHIFSGLFRADAAKVMDTEGMGLGLSLVKNVIERLDGTVGFNSPGIGKGSTFWFELPKAAAPSLPNTESIKSKTH